MKTFSLNVDCESGDVKFVATNEDGTSFEFAHTMAPVIALQFAEQMHATLAALAEAQKEFAPTH